MYRTFSRDDGSISVEFALVFIPFLISIMFVLELCREIYFINAMDLVISESGYSTSVNQTITNNAALFNKDVVEKFAKIPFTSDAGNISTSISYCMDLKQLEMNNCTDQNPAGHKLAMYTIQLNYNPMFFKFPIKSFDNHFKKNVFLVQEY
ncbi:TPA: TadE/TadG family type IV pilus assembly protein [Enterobacter hormaechei]